MTKAIEFVKDCFLTRPEDCYEENWESLGIRFQIVSPFSVSSGGTMKNNNKGVGWEKKRKTITTFHSLYINASDQAKVQMIEYITCTICCPPRSASVGNPNHHFCIPNTTWKDHSCHSQYQPVFLVATNNKYLFPNK